MTRVHLTPAEAGTIRTALDTIEQTALRPPDDAAVAQRRITECVETIRYVLDQAQARGTVH